MIGRFCRFFPAYTAEAALRMPASRFFAMSQTIAGLAAEEDRRALHIAAVGAHPGEKAEVLRTFERALTRQAEPAKPEKPITPGITPGVQAATDDIRSERLRKRDEYKRRATERRQ